MEPIHEPDRGSKGAATNAWLGGLALAFLGLATFFVVNHSNAVPPKQNIPLVDRGFLSTTPWRQTYADLVRNKQDLSDYDCYTCHDKAKPPPIRYDANNKIIVPQEHADVVMGHGFHDRNNYCYNCHNEQNLETLRVREGTTVKFDNIPELCGSCHGPIYRDWEAGAHGRTSGYWDRQLGGIQRLSCANCHNPHKPQIPTRAPAPPPHQLRGANLEHEAVEARP